MRTISFRKILLIVLALFCLWRAVPVNAADVFDAFLIQNIRELNEAMIGRIEQADPDSNILILSKLKEILQNASGEELTDVGEMAERLSAPKIKHLVTSELEKRSRPSIISELNYFERAVLDTRPVEDASCNKVDGRCYLSGLNPARPSLDLPDLELSPTSAARAPKDPKPPVSRKVRGSEGDFPDRDPDERQEALWKYSPAKTFFVKFRLKLWNREYQESEFYPASAAEKVFVQNPYRVECLDAFSGKVRWTFYPGPHNGYDEKITIRSNLYDKKPSFHMAVENDTIYAELVNQFIRLDVVHDKPIAKWQVSLGVYSLASKPHIVGDGIFVALINDRGELWGVMFDKENGAVLWSTYIALVTQVCPSSDLITHDDSTLYFVTNRGVSVAFHLAKGSVKWLSEYPIKQYRITDVLKKDGLFWRFVDVPYATSWVGLDGDMIVMKPRDSDALSFRDKETGKELAHFYLEDISFLMLDGTKAFFLKDGVVIAVDLFTGEQTRVAQVPDTQLRDILRDPVQKECIMKLGASLFLLRSRQGAAHLTQLKAKLSDEGWLRGDMRSGMYFDCSKDSIVRYGSKTGHIVGKGTDIGEPQGRGRSFANRGPAKSSHGVPEGFMKGEVQDDFVLAEGEKVRSLAVQYDSPNFPYFLILKQDVLICAAKKDARVVWTKRVMGSFTHTKFGAFRSNFVLKAAVYGEVLVIFDGINLLGLDADSGTVRWNVRLENTSERELLFYQTMVMGRNKAYSLDVLLDPDVVVYFKGGTLYSIVPETGETIGEIATGHRYITGFKREGQYLMGGYLFDAKIALYDYPKMSLISELDVPNAAIGDVARRVSEAKGDAVEEHLSEAEYSIAFQYPCCYLQTASGLWSFDLRSKKVGHMAGEFATQKDWRVGMVGREVVSFNPTWKLVIWDEGLKRVKKEIFFSSKSYDDSMHDVWQYVTALSQLWILQEATFFHPVGSVLVCPVKDSDGIYVVGIDVQRGTQLWKIFVTNVYPKIWHMSNSVVMGHVICFTLSVKAQSQGWVSEDSYVETTFMAIDAEKGTVIKRLSFPQGMSWVKYSHYLSAIENSVLVNENDERIRVLRIKA